MFSFFRKRTPVVDIVFMSHNAKYHALYECWLKDKNTCIIFWFEDSLQAGIDYFSKYTQVTTNLLLVQTTTHVTIRNQPVIFAEHYPLQKREEDFYEKIGVKKAQVYSSLMEPLFILYGQTNIINLMERMGMKEDEALSHSLISSSIKKIQTRIAKEIIVEQPSKSAEEWFPKNFASQKFYSKS